jgi:uncharacterized tellurite resistance protein B-like protein
MSDYFNDAIANEYDAAMMLFCMTALADGQFMPEELAEIKNQVSFLQLNNFFELKQHEVSNWDIFLENLDLASKNFSLEHFIQSLPEIAAKITDKDLKSEILSALFSISYSDDEFHSNEKIITEELAKIWNI